MERQRHTKDIAHPIYEIIDNDLSAVEDWSTKQCHND